MSRPPALPPRSSTGRRMSISSSQPCRYGRPAKRSSMRGNSAAVSVRRSMLAKAGALELMSTVQRVR